MRPAQSPTKDLAEEIRLMSLYGSLDTLFDLAKQFRSYALNATAEAQVAAFLVEELAPVVRRTSDLIDQLAVREVARRSDEASLQTGKALLGVCA